MACREPMMKTPALSCPFNHPVVMSPRPLPGLLLSAALMSSMSFRAQTGDTSEILELGGGCSNFF